MSSEQDPNDPTGVRESRIGRGGPNQVVARARERKANAALQLKVAGANWEEIAEVIGYPSGRAAIVAVERALERELRTEQSQARMRALAGKRLESLLRSCWPKAINPDHPEHLTALTKARELINQHVKLYGLEAPSEVVVHSPTTDELQRWVSTVVQAQVPALEEYDIFSDDVVEGEVIGEGDNGAA